MKRFAWAVSLMGLLAAQGALAEVEPEYIDGHLVLYFGGTGAACSDKIWYYDAAKTSGKQYFQNDAIASLTLDGNCAFPANVIYDAYMIRWLGGSFFGNQSKRGGFNLGAGGLKISGEMNGWLTASNIVHLAASQVWTNYTSSAGTIQMPRTPNEYRGYALRPFVLTAEDDVALTVRGKVTWNMRAQAALTNNDVTIENPAVLNVLYIGPEEVAALNAAKPNWPTSCVQNTAFNARKLTLKGSASTIESAYGRPCRLAGTVAINDGGSLTVNGGKSIGLAMTNFADRIVVESGTGTLAGVIAPDEEAFPIKAEAGATLTVGCKFTGDTPTRLALSGAGTVVINATGVTPEIASVQDFTGTLELKSTASFAEGVLEAIQNPVRMAGGTVLVTYPKTTDLSAFTIASGKTATLKYATPRPPAAYLDGYALVTGISDETVTNGWKFTLYHDATPSDNRTPDMAYSIVDGTLRVDLNEPPIEMTLRTSAASAAFENKVWVYADGTTNDWRDGAIATLQYGKNTSFNDKDVVLGGLRWASFSSYFHGGAHRAYLGPGGISFTSSSGIRFWTIKELRLIASQTWTGPSGTINLGDNSSAYKSYFPRLVTADEDVVLTVTGPISVYVNCLCDFGRSDIVLTNGSTLKIDGSKLNVTDIALNARTLTLQETSTLLVQSDHRVDGGYTVADKVVLMAGETGAQKLTFDKTATDGYAGFDIGSVEVTGAGTTASLEGTAYFNRATAVPVTIPAGCTLDCKLAFTNATERPDGLKLLGAGTWRSSSTHATRAFVFTNGAISDFTGTVEVPANGILRLSGEVDFPALKLGDGAVVQFNLDNGDKIADWSKVQFPVSGTVTLQFCRNDSIAVGEGTLDTGMDLSGLAAADRAKLRISILNAKSASAVYTVTATPRIESDGHLYADLSATISKPNNSDGGTVWLGKDWGDATDLSQWAYFTNGAAASDFDPSNHPASLDALKNNLSSYGIYSSMDWHLDLKGATWTSGNGRSNADAYTWHHYGISNGTLQVGVMMACRCQYDVEYGATLNVLGHGDKYWYVGSQSSPGAPSLVRIHNQGAMEFFDGGKTVLVGLYSTRYQVDAGGRLSYHPTTSELSTGHRMSFDNAGELTFPHGFEVGHSSGAKAGQGGGVDIVQNGGTLSLAGAFTIPDRDTISTAASATLTLAGGTTVLSNGITFADWDLGVAADAAFALEIPKGGDFTTDGLTWGEGFALEKKGEGVLRLAVTNEVGAGSVAVSAGALAGAAPLNVGALNVDLTGGALAADASAADVLTITNGTVSATGGWKVKALAAFAGSTSAIPFLTVAAANDPQLTTDAVTFLNARGKPVNGSVAKEAVTVGDIPCVRYTATFSGVGTLLIVR